MMCAAKLAKYNSHRSVAEVSFSNFRAQIEQLPYDEMVKTLACLESRLQTESNANAQGLSRLNAEIDGGRRVRWNDLKRLGLS
jgi:hypothetical protein